MALNTRLLSLKDSEVKLVVLLIPLFEVSFWVDLLDGWSLKSRLLILVSFVRVSIFTILAPILSGFSVVIRVGATFLVICSSAPTLVFIRRNGLRLFVLDLRSVYMFLMLLCLLFPLRGLSFHNLRCAGMCGSDILGLRNIVGLAFEGIVDTDFLIIIIIFIIAIVEVPILYNQIIQLLRILTEFARTSGFC